MDLRLLLGALVTSAVVMTGQTAQAQGLGDVDWCLNGDATNTIFQQPMDRGYCAWVAGGSAVGVWFAPQFASYVMTKIQRDWSRDAAVLACNQADPQSQAAAIGLLAACQCHNQAAADWIVNNPAPVLRRLREFAGCPSVTGSSKSTPTVNAGAGADVEPRPAAVVVDAD